jgi:cellobiose phosphorylase
MGPKGSCAVGCFGLRREPQALEHGIEARENVGVVAQLSVPGKVLVDASVVAALHRLEPYVYPQMIAGPESKKPGEAKNSWLTGTASWAHVAVSQYIFGIRPDYDGLHLDPCIPRKWPGFRVTRSFRGAEYLIEVTNPNHVSKGVRRVEVNGKAIDGVVVPPQLHGTSNRVFAVMGEG